MQKKNAILKYFPERIEKSIIEAIVDKNELIEEIRIRVLRPIILKLSSTEIIVKCTVTQEELLNIIQKMCENSIYSYQNEIASGFITLKGGHRVGISGSCVVEAGKVININYIYSLNFRIARQILGAANKVLSEVLNLDENIVYNTLIVSSPGAGKTTILKDLIRQLSSGIKENKFKAINVGVVDERGEITALFRGIPQNDVGIKVDIIENVSKNIAINMLVRSMTPNVIVADEIGNKEDVVAINYAFCSGVKGIFTAHGSSLTDLMLNPVLKELINLNVIERIIFLDESKKGSVKEIYYLEKKSKEYRLKEKI